MPLLSHESVLAIEKKLESINRKMNGDALRGRYESSTPTSLRSKLGNISGGLWSTTAAPTATYQRSYDDVATIFSDILKELKDISDETKQLETLMEKYNAPFTPGRLPVWNKN